MFFAKTLYAIVIKNKEEKQMQVTISANQAVKIAADLWADIADYIEAHKEEFQQFIAENGDSGSR